MVILMPLTVRQTSLMMAVMIKMIMTMTVMTAMKLMIDQESLTPMAERHTSLPVLPEDFIALMI